MKLCLVIPNYNHAATINPLLTKLAPYNLFCIIVDDGSDAETKAKLKSAEQQFNWVEVITLEHNQGKGAAMQHGFKHAFAKGYTHALQIDADGQHNTDDIPLFIELSLQHPDYLISGKPIYDRSIPKSRLHGRKINNFWVVIETWSLSIPESMCGFRIYPLQPTLSIMKNVEIGKRMDFDTDILVRLYWNNNPTLFVPTKVIYPEGGISHFKVWRDNLLISAMHTRLFFGMLQRIPQLIMSKLK